MAKIKIMSPDEIAMYLEHYGATCIAIAIAANVSPSSIQNNARKLNRILNLNILQ